MNPRLPTGRRRRAVLLAAAAVAVIAVSAALVGPGGAPRAGIPAAGGTPAGDRRPATVTMTHPVSVVAGPAATVELQAAQGQLTIVGSATGLVTLTGELHWTGHAPIASTRLNRVAGILRLSYRCAAASPCGGNYRLVVPRRTAVVVHEPSGHVIITGLAGPLRITARSVDVSATGLRSPSLAARITSGRLSAVFDAGSASRCFPRRQPSGCRPARPTRSGSGSRRDTSMSGSREPRAQPGQSRPGSTLASSSCCPASGCSRPGRRSPARPGPVRPGDPRPAGTAARRVGSVEPLAKELTEIADTGTRRRPARRA
jgi:hypothetical protein